MVAVALIAAWLSVATGQEMRTWADKSGRFKIQAKFVEMSGKSVVLEKEDGSQVKIPLDKLSEADQKAVAEMGAAEESPFETMKPAKKASKKTRTVDEDEEESAPRKSAKKKTTVVDADEEEPAARPPKRKRAAATEEEDAEAGEGGPRLVRPRWTGVKEVLAAGGGKWDLTTEAPEESAGLKKAGPIPLPSKVDFFEHVAALAINPVCRRAAIGYTLDKIRAGGIPGSLGGGMPGREGQTRIVLCDLESGEVLAAGTTAGKSALLALSDDGEHLLMRREDMGFNRSDLLETWRLTNSGIDKELQWSPHDEASGRAHKIQWASYVDKDRFITASSAGPLVVWNAANAKPLYYLRIHGQCRPALSPDRKYVAFAVDKQIGVLDVTAGRVVAMQEPDRLLTFPAFAFTPRGTRLVCRAHDRIVVWDAATGAVYREIPLAGLLLHGREGLLCPSEEHLLISNSLLVDIDSQAKLWTYRRQECGAVLGGVCWFVVSPHSGAGGLVPTALPHPGAQEQIEKAMQSADFFVVKPGCTVNVNAGALSDPAEREKAVAALTKKLEANGCQVAPNSSIELVATVETLKRRELSYRGFGPLGGGSTTYNFQEYASRVKFVSGGQTLWETGSTNYPGMMISLSRGETVEQYLRARERPNYSFFASVQLPKMVQKPSQGGSTIGTSEVTPAGIR